MQNLVKGGALDRIIECVIHAILLLLLPPLILGIINKTKAWFGGRKGPPVLQTYYDIVKLLQKGMVLSATTSWVFRVGPVVTLFTMLMAGLLIPIGNASAPIHFNGDIILFAYLFALSRFFTTVAALDTGSSFEGMGSAREATLACLSEPALFFAFMVLAKMSGSYSLTPMLHSPSNSFSVLIAAPLVLIAIGLFILLLTECCRIPVDDPNTHLELTMIHEVMVLDHSGPLLGLISYSSAVKLFILGTVLLHILIPVHIGNIWVNWLMFIAEICGLAIVIGVTESVIARLQIRHVPYLLVSAILFCIFGYILLVR
jgi:formate hydrogenlyase subunit 4